MFSTVSFADVVHQSISFSAADPAEALLLRLIDTPWLQRLRDVSQTANTRLVYMFSEHSRFGHSLGVAYLAKLLIDKLMGQRAGEVAPYRPAVLCAALLHDLGHLAPGSHTAGRAWFPEHHDSHELLALNIIRADPLIQEILAQHSTSLADEICRVLSEDRSLPPWTWEIVSGGGWNVDRGNWCIVDSIMAGVTYGQYNIPALTDSIVLTNDQHLALRENRLDAMMHFIVSRHAMYRQIYQHRVLLAADTLTRAIVKRARDLGAKLEFVDWAMRQALDACNPQDLPLAAIFAMRESWWRYHLNRWCEGSDTILADLSNRLLHRRLFKTVRIAEDDDPQALLLQASQAVSQAGYEPRYYLHQISTSDTQAGDRHQSMLVLTDSGRLKPLSEADPLFGTLIKQEARCAKGWLALPAEAKELLGRRR